MAYPSEYYFSERLHLGLFLVLRRAQLILAKSMVLDKSNH